MAAPEVGGPASAEGQRAGGRRRRRRQRRQIQADTLYLPPIAATCRRSAPLLVLGRDGRAPWWGAGRGVAAVAFAGGAAGVIGMSASWAACGRRCTRKRNVAWGSGTGGRTPAPNFSRTPACDVAQSCRNSLGSPARKGPPEKRPRSQQPRLQRHPAAIPSEQTSQALRARRTAGMGRGAGVAAAAAATPAAPEKSQHRLHNMQHAQPPADDTSNHAKAMEAELRRSRAAEMAAWDVW